MGLGFGFPVQFRHEYVHACVTVPDFMKELKKNMMRMKNDLQTFFAYIGNIHAYQTTSIGLHTYIFMSET